jgi:hypothetical protein
MRTVALATTVPAGRSAGSLQVKATSPARAAGLPLIMTVALPAWTVARLAGGRTKLPPSGLWGGVLLAVLHGGGLAHDVHVAAQAAVDHPGERVRDQHGRPGRRLDQVHVGGHNPVALLGGWLPHPRPPRAS